MIITPLKILHLEDLPDDAEMVARELKKTIKHAEILHVDNKEDYIKALENFSPDIILSDHSLPSFDSHEALAIILKGDFSIPFILVTATVSEEYAVEIIKEGADDYILKERLQRLPAAIENALERRKAEGARKKAEDTLRASERKYKLLFDHNPLPMWMISKSTLEIIAVNEAAVSHYGYTREEFLHMNSRDLRPAEDAEQMMTAIRQDYTASKNLGVWRHLKKDGTIILVDVVAHDVLLEGNMVRLILGNDVTERLRSEEAMAKQQVMQQHLITETSIRAQEKEREEIGKELHDNINQLLATAVLFMDFAVRKDGIPPGALAESRNIIQNAIGEIRKLSHSLVGPSLGEITLIKAIEELIGKIDAISSTRLHFSSKPYPEHGLKKEIKLMIYRVVQEQLNNILKHSKAKSASVELSVTDSEIVLLITDDGVGFDTGTGFQGIGLRNIHNRISLYDGVVDIHSAPGEGCRMEVRVPLMQEL